MTNPLQQHVDNIDNPAEYVPPTLTPRVAQYLLKALDYLHIYAKKHGVPLLIEPELHDTAEQAMTDIILEAPEEDTNG